MRTVLPASCMQRVCGMADNTCSSSKDDLVQNVYAYITKGTYPGGATTNEKRVIRRKAKNFEVRDGELLYKNRPRRGRRYKVKMCSYSS